MSSSIGPAALALAALLEAAAADVVNPLYQVQITFGPPDQHEEQQVVAFVGLDDLLEQSRVLGPQPNVRDENYALRLAVKNYDPAGTAKSTWTRGVAMYEAVREVVLANPMLSATVQWALPTPRSSDGAVPPLGGDGQRLPGWVIHIDMAVICKARA